MTYCENLVEPITKRVNSGKSLDEIAKDLCISVKNPRQKAIRIIRELLGEDYLIEHAETLGYDTAKAKLGKIPKAAKLRKIEAATDSEPDINSCKVSKSPKNEAKASLEDVIRGLVDIYGIDEIQTVLDEIQRE